LGYGVGDFVWGVVVGGGQAFYFYPGEVVDLYYL
jgi:hypothetical protein